MDVYHKVLVKLFAATGGKESEVIDLKELVKKEGFLPSYEQIKAHLSRESWITETSRVDAVKITHWGVKEARQVSGGDGGGAEAAIRKDVTRLVAEARELVVFLEELAAGPNRDAVGKCERKLADLNTSLQKVKSSLA